VGQMTIFSGPERRRRWSEAERLQILTEAFSAEGCCVAEVARRHDVSTGLIYTWRRKLWQPVAESGPATPGETGFTEAVVVDDVCAAPPTVQPTIVVDLAQGGRVSVFASASPAVAAAVLKALVR
jgi:transposase